MEEIRHDPHFSHNTPLSHHLVMVYQQTLPQTSRRQKKTATITIKAADNRKPTPTGLPPSPQSPFLSPKCHHHHHASALGSIPVLIASSADWARKIMKTHDLTFASQPQYKAFKKALYGCRDVTSVPYGEYWRQIKSIAVLQLLSNNGSILPLDQGGRNDSSCEEDRGISGAVDLSAMISEFSNDGIGRSAFGRRYSESENGKKFLLVMLDLMELLERIKIGDFNAGLKCQKTTLRH